jgi:zinc transport system substrate-binding protein
MKRQFLLWLLISGFVPAVWAHQHAAPQVVVSIKPIHSLVAAVMEGVGEPQLLIKGAGSPHGYSLRPSEAQMLAKADLVIWVGEGLETFLVRPLANLGSKALQLELAHHLESKMLPIREGGAWEGHGHDAHGPDAHGHDKHGYDKHSHDKQDQHAHDDHDGLDPHLWTSPVLAKDMVRLIAEKLATVDPANAALYAANAASLTTRLDQLFHEVKEQLQPVGKVPYIVFHDAYQYFERDFGLSAVGSVTIDTERSPGVRRVQEVRSKIGELLVRAVFSEPQFQSRIVATVIEGSGAKAGVLDPLGVDLPEGPEAYFLLIRGMGASILATLQ